MKNYYLIFILLLFISKIHSQNIQSIDSTYINYFELPREVPYLHLNKTSFLQGEEIWFKAYVLNLNSQKLHQSTSNLYCTIFDENGNQKDKKLLSIENGLAFGSFKVDSTFTSKNYYIKAHTNFMKNFKEDETFLQKITIIDNVTSKKNDNSNTIYDLQILPEGGHLLSNTLNTVGIVLKNSLGKGLKIQSGKILNSKGNEITSYTTNQFGLGKASFFVDQNEVYSTQITLDNNEKIIKALPSTEQKGVILSVENPHTNIIKINIKTNNFSLKELIGLEYYFLIHNTNSYLKRRVKFKSQANDYTYYLNNKKISPGTNIITLFDQNNNPISERIFFNYQKSIFSTIDVVKYNSTRDSTSINLFKKKKDSLTYFLSTSILPKGTESNNPENSISSKFLLKPYVNGFIENPKYYFTEINRKKLINLDLLLLTQGWSKYKWNYIFNQPPKMIFMSENGINIKGKINMQKAKDSSIVFLFSKENNLIASTFLNGNSFNFKDLYLRNNSDVKISISNKGKIEKPKSYITFLPIKHIEKINISKINISKLDNYIHPLSKDFGSLILNDYETIDTVIINAKRTFKNKPYQLFGHYKSIKVNEEANQDTRILDYIRFQGFKVKVNPYTQEATIGSSRGPEGINVISPTLVFLDGMEIQSRFVQNTSILFSMILSDFEEIFVSKGINGGIHLYSRKNKLGDFKQKRYNELKVPFGFANEKEYYQPNYISTKNKTFKNHGAIFWKPNITINKNEISNSIKFNKLNQKEFKVFIEGITSDGKLISTEKIITIE